MRIGKPLLTACVAVFAAILILSWLPHAAWQNTSTRNEVAVFRSTPAVRLTNSNLVDVLVGIQLKERVDRVEWNNAILSIDMKVNTLDGRPSLWFADIEKLLRVAFLQLENVKRVLIRMLEDRSEGTVLLAAVDVRKTDSWLISDMDVLKHADPVHDELWRKRLRVNFTSAWEDRFGPITGFSIKPVSIINN